MKVHSALKCAVFIVLSLGVLILFQQNGPNDPVVWFLLAGLGLAVALMEIDFEEGW